MVTVGVFLLVRLSPVLELDGLVKVFYVFLVLLRRFFLVLLLVFNMILASYCVFNL